MVRVPLISPPPVPYDATAIRPGWADLPDELRRAIVERLGVPVRAVRTAGAGFTRGFASVLHPATGQPVFVKAAPLDSRPDLVQWYVNEAEILARMPAHLPVPRPRWTLTAAGHFVLCLEAIAGRLPRLPWLPAELSATLAAYARVSAALREPPADLVALGLPTLAGLARSDLAWWREIAAGRESCPALPAGLADKLTDQLPQLVALEALLPGYAETRAVIHCDLRLDNVLLDRRGQAWICDWSWLCHGPAWFDLASLLVTAYGSGLDADRAFVNHPAAADTPPDALDAALAALAGHWLTRAGADPTTASPYLQAHQRWSGELALRWLAERRAWV